VVLRTIRRVTAGDLNVKGSALLRQRVRLDPSAAALNSERRRHYVNLAVRRLGAGLLAKRAARENEVRMPMVNLADNHGAERLLKPSIPPDSQSAERKSPKDQHHCQGHNNSGAILLRLRSENFRAARFLKQVYNSRRLSFYNNSAICTAFNAAPLSS
jgi:hypothetical protein